MSTDRENFFKKAEEQANSGALDEAFKTIKSCTPQSEKEFTLMEIRILNTIISEKLTSCSFEEKKQSCLFCLELLEGIKITKSSEWLELYVDSVYDVFSKLSRYTREEERKHVWDRLKEIYYEITLAAKKVWKDKNSPNGLEVYLTFAKLLKSYLDVADEDSFKICESYAKEAKFAGKGTLDDDDYREAKKTMETINKMITDAKKEQETLMDE